VFNFLIQLHMFCWLYFITTFMYNWNWKCFWTSFVYISQNALYG